MKKIFTTLWLGMAMHTLSAHTLETDSVTVSEELTEIDYSSGLKRAKISLLPSNFTVQGAGSIGYVSVGAGWDYGHAKQWSTEGLLGYVPAYDTDRSKLTLTLRQTYTPWQVDLSDKFYYEPLRTGMYVSTTLGKQFWFSAPEKYPSNYYTFSTKVRFNMFVGQSFGYHFASKKSYFEGVKLYYDLHTTDLYLISRVQNSYLKAKDYFGLAIGAKLQIRRR